MESDGSRSLSGMRRYPAAYPCSTPRKKTTRRNGRDAGRASHKEVIDVHDGKRLGRVMDIEFCTADSRVTALVVPAETSFFQTLRGEKCGLVIPWEDIQRIGDDVILVSTKCSCACRQDGTHWE